jgi:voltage-gated potassium channel
MGPVFSSLRNRLGWPLLLVAIVVAYGTAGYVLLLGWPLLDALYMTLTTLTTVGFQEIHPLSTGGRIFTMTVIVFGVSTLLVTVTMLAGWVAEGVLGETSRRRRMERRVDKLSDHFIICAYGRVGRAVAREFEAEDQPFVVVEVLEDKEEDMIEDGVLYILDDPSHESVLKSAGVERAKGLVCAVDSDATNVYIALIARSLNDDIFIVARASEPDSTVRLYRAGVDRVISPYVTSGRHMAQLALKPQVVDYLEVSSGDSRSLRLEEVAVDERSPLVDKTVEEASGGAHPLAIRHANGEVEPHPDPKLQLHAGDLLVLLGEEEVLRRVEER